VNTKVPPGITLVN